MVARVLRRLAELLDREVGRGEVGVAEAEVDDVVTGAAELEREVADHREDVRRQVVDPAELHATSLDGLAQAIAGTAIAAARLAPTATTSPTITSAGDSSPAASSAQVCERARDGLLLGQRAARDDGCRRRGRQPGGDEAAAELLDPLEPHEEHERAAGRGERRVVGLAAVGAVPARDRDAVGDAAMGDGDQCRGRHGRDRRDAGDDLEGNAGLGERERLLAAATEDERVAALEPDDVEAGRRRRRRAGCVTASCFMPGARDHERVVGRLVDELLGDERVGDEHVARRARARARGR